MKNISNEMRSLNRINNACIAIKEVQSNFNLKVPLACSVDYLGYKCLVIAKPPYNCNLVYGLDTRNPNKAEFKEKYDLKPQLK